MRSRQRREGELEDLADDRELLPGRRLPGRPPDASRSATVSPTTINIDSSGVLQSTFTVSATTTNLDIAATVTAIVQTQTGAASLTLPASNSCVSGGACNTWTATFAPGGLNLRFLPGSQVLYLTATQPVGGAGGTNGSSAVATTNTVTFG